MSGEDAHGRVDNARGVPTSEEAEHLPAQAGAGARSRISSSDDPINNAINNASVLSTGDEPEAAPSLAAVPTEQPSRRRARGPRADAAPSGDVELLWKSRLHCDGQGRPFPNLENVMIALRDDPGLREAFSYDEFSREVRLMQQPPRPSGGAALEDTCPREFRDIDCSRTQEYLQRHALPTIGSDTTSKAIHLRASERPIHPVRDYLDSLKWDGRRRVEKWLSYYVGADDSPYARQVGTMFLTAAIARIREPGCKVDYMPVLEGEQGIRKSEVCAVLGRPWYTDGLPDIRNGKEASQHLRGVWFVEIAELSAIGKAEVEALKAFLTRQTERYRPPYAREEVVEPRQCVFIGTTNATAYLRDDTGARRFWPVKVKSTDCESLARDRDQLFAEADCLFKSGAKWYPEAGFEAEHIRPEQEARYEEDPWADKVKEFVTALAPDSSGARRVKVTQVAVDGLFFDRKAVGTREQRRISAILKRLGYIQTREETGRWYVEGPTR